MNIAFISSLTRIATANYVASALRRSGHTLLVVSDVPTVDADCVTGGAPDIARLCVQREFSPDLVLFVEGGTMKLFPVGLEDVPCPTAWYAIDTHMNPTRHLRLARLFDVTFVAQKEYVRRLQADGVRSVEWLPLAFPADMLPAAVERDLDLAFVGSTDPKAHPQRAKLLRLLRQTTASTAIGPATPAEMIRRYAQARIVFNKSINNDVNMRYFEAMGAGAVLLTDAVVDNGVEDLWEPGRDFVQYDGEEDLVMKFTALLADGARLRAIAAAGKKTVLESHTYDHRARAIVQRMAVQTKAAHAAPADYFAAFAALNMLPEALAAVASELRHIGPGTRLVVLNRLAAILVRALALLLKSPLRLAGWLRR